MIDLENKAFASCAPHITPRIWYRFVDDIISIVKRTRASQLLEHLNLLNDRIQFTMETEGRWILAHDGCDVHEREGWQTSETSLSKQTHTNRHVQFSSHHPMAVKSGIIVGLADRALQVSSSQKLANEELAGIKQVMVNNGYSKLFIEKTIKKQVGKRNLGTDKGK